MRRALLSVSDKTGIEALARGLVALGFEVVSTGGTHKTLQAAGLPVRYASDITGFPEILNGRVKTLHPKIHGGILAKREEGHLSELTAQGIAPVDLVAVNLYPFRETVARGASFAEAVETIDIGGLAMLRAAAKNHAGVLPLCDPADYDEVAQALSGEVSLELRRRLARKAFAHTAAYDAAIVTWLDGESGEEPLPPTLHLALERADILRYGENPHQRGARYRETGQRGLWDEAVQHGGVALSYLNLFDAEAAWELAHELSETPAAVIVKHANPCGVAVADDIAAAYERAFAADPKSAFGGVIALNRPVSENLAAEITAKPKADVLIAPGFEEGALARFATKRKTMRVIEAPAPQEQGLELRPLGGGFLVQEPDRVVIDRAAWRVVTERAPTEDEWRDLELAWRICARTKSNAIVLVKDLQAVGVGAGQQSRVDAAELAARKAAGRAQGGACASDAFYPFRDGLDAAAAAGATAVIQPGGSVRDGEVIKAADKHGLAMVFTGRRHFRH
jgi:phosphoribosylaminoimidazolecarboxamide formyltransferase/IMP cyclohydrolase